jgi:hypothetical protein
MPRRIAAACDPGPSRLFLVPSPLLWYGLSELLLSMSQGSAVLCVEADPALAELARARMPAELASDGRLSFIESGSSEAAIAAASAMGNFRSCVLVALSGGVALHWSAYESMASALTAFFEAEWRNRAALMVLGPRWAKNIFDNIAALGEICPQPPPRFPGSVVVCGAGPSLEAALPFISRESSQGRLGVIACDTALGSLLSSGITPDLVVCLEGQAHNLPDFTCAGSKSVALAADLSSHPATFRILRGPKHLSIVRITTSPLLDRAAAALSEAGIPFLAEPPLGSVGVFAAHLARSLADGPVIATGLDFSFEAGKTHARGCPSLLAEEYRLDRLTRWPGQFAVSFRDRTFKLDGRSGAGPSSLLSDPILVSYASLLADGEAEAGRRGPLIYDIRGRGPSIGGRRISLAEATALVMAHPNVDVKADPVTRPRASIEETVHSFLTAELFRLEELRRALRGGTKASRGELARLVAETDYLCWGFPDQSRGSELAQDFLNRLVPQLEYWAQRLKAILG